MTLIEATRVCTTSRYADFSGRGRRRELWLFTLVLLLATVAFAVLDSLLFGTSWDGYGPLSIALTLATFVPSLSATVRRLHDTGRSGWYALLVLVPLLGWIVLLVLAAQDGSPGHNAYGPDPKAAP